VGHLPRLPGIGRLNGARHSSPVVERHNVNGAGIVLAGVVQASIRTEILGPDAFLRSLNICNHFEILHGAHAFVAIFAVAKQPMLRRRATYCWRCSMKKLLTTSVVLATVFMTFASPAFAAKHRASVVSDTMAPYGQPAGDQLLARPSDVVTSEGRIIGADPDQNIRTQLLRDLDQAGF
jgi:hypothetical protein